MKKRILSLVLTLVMLLSVSPLGALNLTASAETLTDGDFEYSVVNNEATITDYTGSATNLTIPDILGGNKVTHIGDSAFAFCTALQSIEIPDSVTTIGGEAFWHCAALTSITIPDSVTTIGDMAFSFCATLKSVAVGNSVTEIVNTMFRYCTALESISVDANNNYYSSVDGVLFNKDLTTLICYPAGKEDASYTIPDSVTEIYSSAFWICTALESVTIGNSVTYIGGYAFDDCTALKSITIPNSVTEIGYSAFSGCTAIESIEIPDSVTSIGAYAFDGCTALKSVTMGNCVTSVADMAFYGCTSLVGVYITNLKAWCEIDFGDDYSNPLYYAGKLYLNNILITNLVIPDGVTSIDDAAFVGCDALESVTIGSSVTSIGCYAFGNCISLESVEIPDSVISIDYAAFRGSTAFTNISVSANNNQYSSVDGVLFNKDKTTLICYPNGKEGTYAIPNTVTSIGYEAFYNSISLEGITIPTSVTSIDYGAFRDCAALKSVTIPNSINNIEPRTFYGCTALESITIPTSVTSISNIVFSGCTALADVYYGGTETEWNNISIGNNNYALLNAHIHFNSAMSCTHSWSWVTDKAATCGSAGTKHQECKLCHQKQNENTKISATGKHSYKCIKTVKATYDAAGYKQYKCTGCTASYTTTIAKLPKTSLAKAKVSGIKDKAYTGKALKQSIKVKLGSKTLSSKNDYSVSYKNNKNIGTAMVTITGKGKYSGSIKKTFTIKPKTASVKTFKSPKKKQAKVTWEKDSKVTGYQIVYATNSKFTKGKKTVTVKSYKTTSKTNKNLKSKKTYYVKIRSYKTVKGKKIYGAYSKVKKVKIK